MKREGTPIKIVAFAHRCGRFIEQVVGRLNSRTVFTRAGVFVCLVMAVSCSMQRDRLKVDVAGVNMPGIVIHRYDLDLFTVDMDRIQQGLERLRPEYRFFLGTNLSDPLKLDEMRAYLQNPRSMEFHAAVLQEYSNVKLLEDQLTLAFRHFRYYFPDLAVPRVYSYISGGDYDYPVRFVDSVLLIGLDNYLGKAYGPYVADGLPGYRVARMNRDMIVPDCMRTLANQVFPAQLPGNNLLEQMVEAGKRLYFIDAMMPDAPDNLKIAYTDQQLDWMIKHEAHVWAAIIDNRLLYTTDGKVIRSFMADGPFTAEFSQESPPRIGEWIGWQIVKRYMDRQPDVTLAQLFDEKDVQKVLRISSYKPEK